MNTILTIGAFFLFAYFAYLTLAWIWGRYEINSEDYAEVASLLKEYPHLKKYLLTFSDDQRITSSELRLMRREAKAIARRNYTRDVLQQRKEFITQYLEEDNDKGSSA